MKKRKSNLLITALFVTVEDGHQSLNAFRGFNTDWPLGIGEK